MSEVEWAEPGEPQCEFAGMSADPEWPEWVYRCELRAGHVGPCRTRGQRLPESPESVKS